MKMTDEEYYEQYGDVTNYDHWTFQELYFFKGNVPDRHIIKDHELITSPCLHYVYHGYIDEHISIHDIDKFKEELLKYFDLSMFSIKENDNIEIQISQQPNKLFFQIIDAYNFNIVDINDDIITIEPTYYKKYDELDKVSYGKAYYFDTKENIEKILDKGIFIRDKNTDLINKIWMFPTFKRIDQVYDDINKFLDFIHLDRNNMDIIQLKLYRLYNTPIYQDIKSKNIFTLVNIDKRYIKKINYNL